MSYRAAAPLIALGSIDLAEVRRGLADTNLRAIPLGDVVVHVTERVRLTPYQDPSNVVAILDGSDPKLRNEYVVYSAHYDHLGIGRADVRGDSIYNGADDNASGTAAVLAVAKALGGLTVRPRRSVIFALVSAEEGMGWGSSFFVDHPPVPASAMVTNINTDMLGRNWRDTVVVLGRHDSDLGQSVDRVTLSHRELGLTVIDSSNRPNDVGDLHFGWSDHSAFILKGIPFLYFYSGKHEDYHRLSDSADKIDYEKLARISRMMFYVGLEVANANKRPQWDTARYKSLVPSR
jgi:Zn-dependent M28 family amino/carboxypeptidase